MDLTDAQIERYSRQIILPALGGRGQQRLLDATVHVVGAGPLAAMTAWYLTAAGIGALELWTGTEVALDRLQLLREELTALNPDTRVALRVGPPSNVDVVVCADVTAAVLEQVNSVALQQRATLLAGCGGGRPHIACYAGHDAGYPCVACDPQPPVSEAVAAASDPTVGLIGSLLALEAIKASLRLPGFRPGTGLHYEPETLTITECPIGKRATCRACAPVGGFET